jgi:uncharacterized protein (TIGR02453 family)
MIQKDTLSFLHQLKSNNNKEWFHTNRLAYDDAKQNIVNYIQAVCNELAEIDNCLANISAKDTLFRINRDIRFSRDKSPYKVNFGASLTKGGRKSSWAGYYIHVEPGQSFLGGGLYMPQPENMYKIRQEIDYDFATFQNILSAPDFEKYFGQLVMDTSMKLSRPPRGYTADNQAIEYIKLTSWVATCKVEDSFFLDKNSVNDCVQILSALTPFIGFLNQALI